jgi:phosphatidylserine/phosphatidylglycerophosphate/cardiolipin synthase-like enzyme
LVKAPHFAHNKFVVMCDAQGHPQRLWTGSTNWTVTGLCTQVNNGLLVDDPVIAADYLVRWKALKDAGSDYPPSLAADGSKPSESAVGSAHITAWNAPVLNLVDLADARKIIQGARQGVLFLMFNPGPAGTLLNDILALSEQNLFVHGVVNADPGGKSKPLLTLHDRGTPIDADPEVVLPSEIGDTMKGWFGKEFRYNMVMIHSKVVVVDPFGAHPVVMTGSHNLGPKASGKNDDNLMIVENAPGLAAEYAVNLLGVYGHYKSRYNQKVAASGSAAQKKKSNTWRGLEDNDTWQDGYYQEAKLREINFWFGMLAPEAPAARPKRK